MKIRFTVFLHILFCFPNVLLFAQTTILNWDASIFPSNSATWQSGSCTPNTGSSSCRPHPWYPSQVGTPITLLAPLTFSGPRGTQAPANSCWGGSLTGSTADNNINWSGKEFSLKFGVIDSYVKLKTLMVNLRRSNSGPDQLDVYYSLNNGTRTHIGTLSGISTNSTLTSYTINFTLASHPDLRNLTTGDEVEFIFITGLGVSNGNFYFGGPNAINLTIEDTPLPVQLVNFSSICDNDIRLIRWETAAEINNDYFLIEKSEDAAHFDFLQKINGQGNSNEPVRYEVKDIHSKRNMYYRLSQFDYDGKATVYPLVYSEHCELLNENIQVLSVQNTSVSFEWQAREQHNALIRIIDINGKCISTFEKTIYEGTQIIYLPTPELINSVYFLQIVTDKNWIKSLKFIPAGNF